MTWWHYLLLVNIYLILFFGFYALLLRRETFFQLNRIYLVGAATLSFIIPLVQARWVQDLFITKQMQTTIYSTTSPDMIVTFAPLKNNPITIGEIVTLLYAAGAVFLAIRLVWQLFEVKQMIKRPSKVSYSFFSTIRLTEHEEGNDVIKQHEEVHARQWHSADILIIEAVMIINWFNPVVYLYRYAIKHIHEYIADSYAVKAGASKADYAMLLLNQTFNAPAHSLINPFFNHSLLKKRIVMLQKNKSQRIKLIKYGLSAPLFMLMLILSSATINNSKAVVAIHDRADEVFDRTAQSVIPDANAKDATNKEIAADKSIQEIELDTVPGRELFTEVEHAPEFPGGDEAFGKFLAKNIKYPKAERENNVQGRVVLTFVVEADGSLSDIKVAKSVSRNIDAEALRVMKASPKWQPGIQNKHKVRVQYAVPIQFALSADNNVDKAASPASGAVFSAVEQSPGFPGGQQAFEKYIVTNLNYPQQARDNHVQGRVIITFVVEKDGSLSNMKVVRSVGSGTDEEAVRVLAASPKWKPGMQSGKPVRVQYTVPITFSLAEANGKPVQRVGKVPATNQSFAFTASTIDTADGKKNTVIISGNKNGEFAPLYILNGKETASIEGINPNDIKSISVIKDKNAILKYGAKGLNGVVLVETKNAKFKL
ncbi:TonB family protein [Mucilaginibacter pallidiroseus]|uniref:TonB family protein n=1 Tax=Mucilaginibacter pallidiroseus TaxID=2599295 RepID=A0A563UGN8_9SPHI|nr:M56 family metallopeptidase [Mucilaginibacter pallidiroseus]TWR30448.1 TonB family protein [Mucilaginibacter pallidiroseus]